MLQHVADVYTKIQETWLRQISGVSMIGKTDVKVVDLQWIKENQWLCQRVIELPKLDENNIRIKPRVIW